MTLENCQRLLKHFNDLADGTITQPFGHKDWSDVVHNAKVRAVEMKKRVEWYNSDAFKVKHGLPLTVKEEPKETKSNNLKVITAEQVTTKQVKGKK